MSRHAVVAALLLAACRTAPAPSPAVQPATRAAAPAVDSVPLRTQFLGRYSWPVTTTSPTAQAYFDQGLRLMYGYAREDAIRSFVQARTVDSTCAMCWWGEAWALGPYLNGPMSAAEAPLAYAAVQRARGLASRARSVEWALIDALAWRYEPVHPAAGRRGLDSAWANAMAAVHGVYPTHADVATLYADALMLLEPRRGLWPLSKPSVQRIHEVLEGVLARDLTHPGACHAYIHATETTPKVGEAQRCADRLGAVIPGVSHVLHMPSHTYNRVGRWGDATRVNLDAVAADRRAGRGEAYAIYPAHNLHMLLFSASVDGQRAVAVQAADDLAAMLPAEGAAYQALVLTRFGMWDELLALVKPPANPVGQGMWAFGRGLAQLRKGRADSAAAHVALLDSIAQHTPKTRTFRQHEPARLVGVLREILRGETLRVAGRTDEAIAAFRAGGALEAGLTYDEPEPLTFTTWDFLGAALLEAGRAAEAVEAYRAALVARPENGWSLLGLERALRTAGRAAEADEAQQRLKAAWARADVTPPASSY